ncbi:hypothetical protein QBC43DRAFT_331591 [Cladorrhinum sp. PSN259]|nr:hypothetical protein QBC43DRAFT_331591 [Cladorrhinum sp. PSN259]
MEPVSLTLAVLGVAKAWVDLQTLVSDGKRISNDLKSFVTYVETERVAFCLWCEVMDMGDLAKKIEDAAVELSGDAGAELPALGTSDVDKLEIGSGMTGKMLTTNIENIMKLKTKTLNETQTFLQSYGAVRTKSMGTRDKLKARLSKFRSRHHNELGEQEKEPQQPPSDTQTLEEEKDKKKNPWDAVRWATSGRQESRRLLEDLTRCNHGLQRLLDLMNNEGANKLKRMIQSATAAAAAANSSTASVPLLEADLGPSFRELIYGAQRQKRFSRRAADLDAEAEATTAFAAAFPTPSNETTAAAAQLGIHKNRQASMIELFTSRRKGYSTKSALKRHHTVAAAAAANVASEMMRVTRLRVPHSALFGLLQPYRYRRLMRFRG